MDQKRNTVESIVRLPREAEIELADDAAVKQVAPKLNINESRHDHGERKQDSRYQTTELCRNARSGNRGCIVSRVPCGHNS